MKSTFTFLAILCLASFAWADSLELRNGSLIKGKFVGGTDNDISFQVGSSVQKYNLSDVLSIRFESGSESEANDTLHRRHTPDGGNPGATRFAGSGAPANLTIPAGTRISIRMIDGVDSTQNHPGD